MSHSHAAIDRWVGSDPYLMLPTWWVKAAWARSFQPDQVFPETGSDIMMFPKLEPSNIGLYGCIFSDIRDAALRASGREVIAFCPLEWRRRFGHGTAAFSRRWSRVLEGLHQAGAMHWDGERSQCVRIFESCDWVRDSSSLLQLQVVLSSVGLELLCGFVDVYSERRRGLAKEMLLAPLLDGCSPLAVKRSVWLDLVGRELNCYLSLIRHAYWSDDGGVQSDAYDVDLAKLMADCHRGRAGLKEWKRSLVLCRRVLKKAYQHGEFARLTPGEFLALPTCSGADHSSQLTLAYRLEGSRNAQLLVDKLLAAWMRSHVEEVMEAGSDKITSLWPEWIEGSDARMLKAAFRLCSSERRYEGLVFSNVLVFPYLFLIVEWFLRGRAQLLPKELLEKNPLVAKVAACSSFENFGKDLAEWLEELHQNRFLIKANMLRHPELSVCANMLDQSDRATENVSSETFVANTSVEESKSMPEIQESPLVAAASTTSQIEPPEKRTRQWAVVTLDSLRSSAPGTFEQLKISYLSSLGAGEKEILTRIKTRLNPDIFEKQLRPRLVQFLMDNPTALLASP